MNALSLTLVHILVVLNEWMDFSREIPYEVDVQTRVGTETYTAPLSKYWRQRYDLFSEWEMGMLLDTEAWYSTTPIIIADHQARLCVECFQRKRRSDLPPVVLDAFCGVGGNSIAFAKVGCKVLACDIDSEKLKMAQHNASTTSVHQNIEFICCNFLELMSSSRVDFIFLSPPWGGPSYSVREEFLLSQKWIGGLRGTEVITRSLAASNNTVCFLPRNINFDDIMNNCTGHFQIESHEVKSRVKANTLYFLQSILFDLRN